MNEGAQVLNTIEIKKEHEQRLIVLTKRADGIKMTIEELAFTRKAMVDGIMEFLQKEYNLDKDKHYNINLGKMIIVEAPRSNGRMPDGAVPKREG